MCPSSAPLASPLGRTAGGPSGSLTFPSTIAASSFWPREAISPSRVAISPSCPRTESPTSNKSRFAVIMIGCCPLEAALAKVLFHLQYCVQCTRSHLAGRLSTVVRRPLFGCRPGRIGISALCIRRAPSMIRMQNLPAQVLTPSKYEAVRTGVRGKTTLLCTVNVTKQDRLGCISGGRRASDFTCSIYPQRFMSSYVPSMKPGGYRVESIVESVAAVGAIS